MKVEVIAIGTEILSGFTVNTNASFISQELLKVGIVTDYHTTVPDGKAELLKAFDQALERSHVVICTGGLGPTCDDITRNVAAEIFDSPFTHYPEIEEELNKRYGNKLTSARDQATLPEKAEIVRNRLGTASGLLFTRGDKALFLLPGVPQEMKAMFCESVLPQIINRIPSELRLVSDWLHFSFLYESMVDPVLREIQEKYPFVKMGIYPFRGKLSVHLYTTGSSPKQSREDIEHCKNLLIDQFGDYAYESPSGSIEEAVHQLFSNQHITLATAESCTGGTIASRLTSLPGASQYFLGGLVTYTNTMKHDFLGVSLKTLDTYGAVSKEVVTEMVEGLIAKTGADYGIAVSGIAGPSGGTPEKPVGTVWIAISGKSVDIQTWLIPGRTASRQMIIDYTVNTALGRLYHLCK